jgi:hypothetical protein
MHLRRCHAALITTQGNGPLTVYPHRWVAMLHSIRSSLGWLGTAVLSRASAIGTSMPCEVLNVFSHWVGGPQACIASPSAGHR